MVAVRMFVKKNVLGQSDYTPHKPKTTYNIADTAPSAWEAIKRKYKQQGKERREEQNNDKTKW